MPAQSNKTSLLLYTPMQNKGKNEEHGQRKRRYITQPKKKIKRIRDTILYGFA